MLVRSTQSKSLADIDLRPFGSLLKLPPRVTAEFAFTEESGPALAIGGLSGKVASTIRLWAKP